LVLKSSFGACGDLINYYFDIGMNLEYIHSWQKYPALQIQFVYNGGNFQSSENGAK
jgi:hypothetical protein